MAARVGCRCVLRAAAPARAATVSSAAAMRGLPEVVDQLVLDLAVTRRPERAAPPQPPPPDNARDDPARRARGGDQGSMRGQRRARSLA